MKLELQRRGNRTMGESIFPPRRELPGDVCVCQCNGCMYHETLTENTELCGTPYLSEQEGTECIRCETDKCPTCSIYCDKCQRPICRECDYCNWCERSVCVVCVPRRRCNNCEEAFCDTEFCTEGMDECDFCGSIYCDTCQMTTEYTFWTCEGAGGACGVKCCHRCLNESGTFSECDTCQCHFCQACVPGHRTCAG